MSTVRLLVLLSALFTAGYLLGRSSLVVGTPALLAVSQFVITASRTAFVLSLGFVSIAFVAERLAALESTASDAGSGTHTTTLSACENLRRRGSF